MESEGIDRRRSEAQTLGNIDPGVPIVSLDDRRHTDRDGLVTMNDEQRLALFEVADMQQRRSYRSRTLAMSAHNIILGITALAAIGGFILQALHTTH